MTAILAQADWRHTSIGLSVGGLARLKAFCHKPESMEDFCNFWLRFPVQSPWQELYDVVTKHAKNGGPRVPKPSLAPLDPARRPRPQLKRTTFRRFNNASDVSQPA